MDSGHCQTLSDTVTLDSRTNITQDHYYSIITVGVNNMLTQERKICMFINFFFEKKYLEKILGVEHEIHKDKAASRILPSCKSWQHIGY